MARRVQIDRRRPALEEHAHPGLPAGSIAARRRVPVEGLSGCRRSRGPRRHQRPLLLRRPRVRPRDERQERDLRRAIHGQQQHRERRSDRLSRHRRRRAQSGRALPRQAMAGGGHPAKHPRHLQRARSLGHDRAHPGRHGLRQLDQRRRDREQPAVADPPVAIHRLWRDVERAGRDQPPAGSDQPGLDHRHRPEHGSGRRRVAALRQHGRRDRHGRDYADALGRFRAPLRRTGRLAPLREGRQAAQPAAVGLRAPRPRQEGGRRRRRPRRRWMGPAAEIQGGAAGRPARGLRPGQRRRSLPDQWLPGAGHRRYRADLRRLDRTRVLDAPARVPWTATPRS